MQIQIDMTDVLKLAEQLKVTQDQVPYAMTRALNEATQVTRTYLIKETWPGSGIKVRNASFIAASLTTKDTRATKFYLESEIYDKLGRGHLYEQAKGGVRSPRGRSHLAVPSSNVPRTARGIPKGLKPLALRGKDTRIGDKIYVRDKKGGKLKLMYTLKPQTKIPKRVPFVEDYNRVMHRELGRTIPFWMAKAMATRR